MSESILRLVQFAFAAVVLGTDARAIYMYHGYTSRETAWFGDYDVYNGVPNAWSFLLFCAAWTILGVVVLLSSRACGVGHAIFGYGRLFIEAIALLSWLAGFIAVAINIGTHTCPVSEHGCALLKAAVVFGAVEFLLFLYTTFLTFKLVFHKGTDSNRSQPKEIQEQKKNSNDTAV